MDTIDREHRDDTSTREGRAAPVEQKLHDGSYSNAGGDLPVSKRSIALQWFLYDLLFIAMLLLALVGVIFRLPIGYWVMITPVFGVISIVEGWSHFLTRRERLGLVYRLASIWCGLLFAIYLIHNGGVQGVMNANARSLAIIILLAFGTFVAGMQARVWKICVVGGILFLVVPGLGWLDQSPLLLAAVISLVVVFGGLVWWLQPKDRLGSQKSPYVRNTEQD
ncbi:hypothetical protein V4R08_10855 [Nitrobacter sp. NHB1]|uniref:hypothetical protein n=1 Tax=Nitrobacter sp. NHB1 TaxID=3119830 RepID=UPI00300019BD